MEYTKRRYYLLWPFLYSLLNSPFAAGFDFSSGNTGNPLEIDAEQGIVCEQHENKCTARGNVVVIQGDTVLNCDQLTAYFRGNGEQQKSQELIRLEAKGQVKIISKSKKQHCQAQQASYNISNGEITLKGSPLILETGDMMLTAHDTLQYFEKTQEAFAKGNALIQRKEGILQADEIQASFSKESDGKLALKKAQAKGNLIVTTSHQTIKGEKGIYTRATDLVQLEGKVTVIHAKGNQGVQMKGEYAELYLASGKSRLSAVKPGETATRKVKILLVPNRSYE